MIPRKTYTVDEAQKKLEYFCSYQERCHQEVRQKLISMHMIPDAIDTIMVSLIRHDYLNESRFARLFVQGKFRIKYWGKFRLKMELKKREISGFNINQALAQISEDDYLKVFDELANKKFLSINESNPIKKKRKLADFLLYRGWESHLVYEKVNRLIN